MLEEEFFLRNRTLLSILMTMALFYYALPQLPLSGGRLELTFSYLWIGFAVVAIGGNLAEYLYQPTSRQKKEMNEATRKAMLKRGRMY
jgi:hypothetical protein